MLVIAVMVATGQAADKVKRVRGYWTERNERETWTTY
jgi:hypothetical protein